MNCARVPVCLVLVVMFAGNLWGAGQVTAQTTDSLSQLAGEMPDSNPLQPNERRIPRSQFTAEMEAYWGIKLSDINDEYVAKKGDETLFIDAGGRVYIKKVAPELGYHGETGKSYASTEEMLQAEKRWTELAEYLKKVGEAMRTFVQRDSTYSGDAALIVEPDLRQVSRNGQVRVRVSVRLAESSTAVLGLALGFDPNVFEYRTIEMARTAKLVRAQLHRRSASNATLELTVKHGAAMAGERHFATIVFHARGRGDTALQPLSVGQQPRNGSTYLELNDRPIKLRTPAEISIHVR